MLPTRPGHAARPSYDYKRHGTTPLFPALNMPWAGSSEIAFPETGARVAQLLEEADVNVPGSLDVHMVMANYATSKTPVLRNLPSDSRTGMSISRPRARRG